MKQLQTTVLLITTLFFMTGCGITQELDESLTASKELQTTLTEQKKIMKDLLASVEKILPAFERDMAEKPETGLFNDEEGALYKNFTQRQDLLSELQAGEKSLQKLQKEIQRISDKKAVDVDHDKLNLISSSLQIIINNYDSLVLYMETGFEQEEALYTNMPVDNWEEQGSVIYRTYGTVSMVAEESISNMAYTTSLIKAYQQSAESQTK